MNKEILKERLDDLKNVYDKSIDKAIESIGERNLTLKDDDIIDITCGSIEIVESAMTTLLMWFYNNANKQMIFDDIKREYLWEYIDEKITFDKLYELLRKESEK